MNDIIQNYKAVVVQMLKSLNADQHLIEQTAHLPQIKAEGDMLDSYLKIVEVTGIIFDSLCTVDRQKFQEKILERYNQVAEESLSKDQRRKLFTYYLNRIGIDIERRSQEARPSNILPFPKNP